MHAITMYKYMYVVKIPLFSSLKYGYFKGHSYLGDICCIEGHQGATDRVLCGEHGAEPGGAQSVVCEQLDPELVTRGEEVRRRPGATEDPN